MDPCKIIEKCNVFLVSFRRSGDRGQQANVQDSANIVKKQISRE